MYRRAVKTITKKDGDSSLLFASLAVMFGVAVVLWRLFVLQISGYNLYSGLALNTHEIYKQLFPQRGNIYIQDTRTKAEFPIAVNRPYYLIYAVPREIVFSDVSSTVGILAEALMFNETQRNDLLVKLAKKNDPYEPVANKISEAIKDKIVAAKLKGIYFVSQEHRYYPEGNLTGQITGFVGSKENGDVVGRYGLEGAWDSVLSGKSGFFSGMRGALGSLIPSADKIMKQAEDGSNLLLTIDRTLQFKACAVLKKEFDANEAKSASLIMMDPNTGAILAMCSFPDYDPNSYQNVKDASYFNNSTIFTPYEPGSIYKPITMSIALDLSLVNPDTTFSDPGVRVINGYKIHNALNKQYGVASMTKVLENSINTGMIWVEEKIGQKRFKEYVEKYGFGKKTGIDLDTEAAGDVATFSKTSPIFGANASFGQGFTATPLQLATAYAALANNGILVKPYIVEEVRHPDGRIEKTSPQKIENVISSRTQKLITGMLVSVVEKTYSKSARLNNYLVAGKTGTAQIAKGGTYSEESNHSFVGYAPANNPRFVLLVKYEAPKHAWAESTAAPVFKEVAEFALSYLGVEKER